MILGSISQAACYESFRLKQPFTIARGSVDAVDVVTVTLTADGAVGRGECRPYARYGETVDSVLAQINSFTVKLSNGGAREALCAELAASLTAGAARNAIDCALWDLAAKTAGQRVYELAGLPEPAPCFATYTLSLGAPEAMATEAAGVDKPILKLKLGAQDDSDVERVAAVRAAAPASRLIIDANEGWDLAKLRRYLPELHKLDVEMIEQPLPAGADGALADVQSPVLLCADESCHTADDVPKLADRYGMVNLKLDKAGGVTGGIALAAAALKADLRMMVGCMMASSLSMAPAQLFASHADYVDLDAPLLLAEDREPPIAFDGARMLPAPAALWG